MVKTIIPDSEILKEYVDFFYVFENNKNENINYIAFPHTNTGIGFFKGVKINRSNNRITINSCKNKYHVEILGKYTSPVFVDYIGPFKEVSIVFKPLGVNQFFSENLMDISPNFSQELKEESWTDFSKILFSEKTMKSKICKLEEFLLHKLSTKPFVSLTQAIRLFENIDLDYSIDKIAALCGMTTKTFQRNFSKHLTCSPAEYKRIARFRNAMNIKLYSKEIKSLTNVSYESNFYDQSYFVREFKKLTKLSPRKFFKEVTLLDEQKIIWKLK